jgi:cyclopropane-fatty-acyl-phospholipid synthase
MPAPEKDSQPAEPAPLTARLWLRLLTPMLKHIETGTLVLNLPDGHVLSGGSGEPRAEIDIQHWRTMRRLLLGGELGLARSWLDGDWNTQNLLAFFDIVQANRRRLEAASDGTVPSRIGGLLTHRRRSNTRRGSRRNIAAHYDLGNEFYRAWLDPSMTYSSAWFDDGANNLESAQAAKYRRICESAGILPGDHILEIGCGWGGFAEVAALEYGAVVDGVTLSTEQLDFARNRAETGGFADRASFHLTDYRDTRGQYDHVVSIEMFEAVGEENWSAYFDVVRERLKPGGRAVLQSITIEDAGFDKYRRRADFIQRYIFPGGMLPSADRFRQAAERAGLQIGEESFFGMSYARTLLDWHRRFNAAWEKIAAMPGFDDRFRRMWNFYLLYCAAGFRSTAIDVGIFRLEKSSQA